MENWIELNCSICEMVEAAESMDFEKAARLQGAYIGRACASEENCGSANSHCRIMNHLTIRTDAIIEGEVPLRRYSQAY